MFLKGDIRKRSSCSSDTPLTDNPYLRIREQLQSLIGKENTLADNLHKMTSPRSVQSQLLKQLQQFHEYYINRYASLKGDYDRLCQQLKGMEDSRQLIVQKDIELQKLQKINEQLENERHGKGNDPTLHRLYESLHHSFNERQRIDQMKHQQEILGMRQQLEDSNRIKANLQKRCDELQTENNNLLMKIKQFEIEKKYEGERLKNATFQLQLQLKLKEEQLKKSQRESSASHSSLPAKENPQFTDQGVETIISGRDKTMKLNELPFVTAAFFQERKSLTQQVKEVKEEEMTQKKSTVTAHRRNLSSTLNNSPSILPEPATSDLKIKILRLEKLKRK